jgi:membrane protein implicated in regulation of membrane protease activity
MNPWPFIYAAYAISLIVAVLLTTLSWRAMRRAEGEAERIGRSS